MTSYFLNIPDYVWKGILEIVKLLSVGIILGLFASRYQKRKEMEIHIKGEVTKLRLEAYKKIAKLIAEFRHLVDPPLALQAVYERFFNGMPFDIQEIEYSFMFDSGKEFDDFYHRLNSLYDNNSMYLDYQMAKQYAEMSGYLSELKMMLDAFCDTESILITDKVVVDQHIKMAYNLAGIVLQMDINKLYGKTDTVIAERMRNIRLSFNSKHIWQKIWDKREKLTFFVEDHIKDKGLTGKICSFIKNKIYNSKVRNYQLYRYADFLFLMFCYINYSDKYSRDEFDKIEDVERENLRTLFHAAIISQYHHA